MRVLCGTCSITSTFAICVHHLCIIWWVEDQHVETSRISISVTFLIPSLCYVLTFSPPFYYVYYRPTFPSTRLSWTYPLSQYLAAMSHYAMSLTPSYSVQTFSRVRFILSHSYL